MAELIRIPNGATLEELVKASGRDEVFVIGAPPEMLNGDTWVTGDQAKRLADDLIAAGRSLRWMGEGPELLVSPTAFKFGRGGEAQQLTQAQRQIRNVEQAIANYTRTLDAEKARAARLTAEIAAGVSNGKPLDMLLEQLYSWPSVVNVTVGPDVDPIGGEFVALGEIFITFLPVLFTGEDQGHRGEFAPTNLIRFRVTELVQGVRSIGYPWGAMHPHMSGDRVCEGNLRNVLPTFIAENDVLGVFALLEAYRLGHHRGDYLNGSWAASSLQWWKSKAEGQEYFRLEETGFGGRWDGETVQRSTGRGEIVKLTEFLDASMDDILHVWDRDLGDGFKYINRDILAAYKNRDRRTAGPCVMCGRASTGCPCHNSACACGAPTHMCRCAPVEGFTPPPLAHFEFAGFTYQEVLREGDAACRNCANYGQVGDGRATWRVFNRDGTEYLYCDRHAPHGVGVINRGRELARRQEAARAAGEPIPQRGTLLPYTGRKRCQFGQRFQNDRTTRCDRLGEFTWAEGIALRWNWDDTIPIWMCSAHAPGREPTIRHTHNHTHDGTEHMHWHDHPARLLPARDQYSRPRVAEPEDHDEAHAADHVAFRHGRGEATRVHGRIR